MSRPSLAIILTFHNRKEKTVSCLRNILEQKSHPFRLNYHLTDDGSTDGTAEAIRNLIPDATIYAGDGNLFWTGGMRLAFQGAMRIGYDYYLWLNDDTFVYNDIFSQLPPDHQPQPSIKVGSTIDPTSKRVTYGGFKRKYAQSPLHLKLIKSMPSREIKIDTMNGNFVLINHAAAKKIGNLDSRFTHGLADLDYGLEASKKDVDLTLLPFVIGTCNRNPDSSRNAKLADRLKKKVGVKNMPVKEWKYFTRKHGKWLWPIYFLSPYLKLFLKK